MNDVALGIATCSVSVLPLAVLAFFASLLAGEGVGISVGYMIHPGFFGLITCLVMSTIVGAPFYLLMKWADLPVLPCLMILGGVAGYMALIWWLPSYDNVLLASFCALGIYAAGREAEQLDSMLDRHFIVEDMN